jgi:ribonuclease HI
MYACRFAKNNELNRVVASWEEARLLTQGIADASVRKFANSEQAQDWLSRAFWTDGSCVGPRERRRSGWAAVEVRDDREVGSVTGKVPGAQTNNRAELCAILGAIEAAGGQSATIYSDSKYAIDALTKYLPGWRRKGWITVRGDPVKNQDLLKEIDAAMHRLPRCALRHVRAHAGDIHNERADSLARERALLGPHDIDVVRVATAPAAVKRF